MKKDVSTLLLNIGNPEPVIRYVEKKKTRQKARLYARPIPADT